jgi:hypothetical protein
MTKNSRLRSRGSRQHYHGKPVLILRPHHAQIFFEIHRLEDIGAGVQPVHLEDFWSPGGSGQDHDGQVTKGVVDNLRQYLAAVLPGIFRSGSARSGAGTLPCSPRLAQEDHAILGVTQVDGEFGLIEGQTRRHDTVFVVFDEHNIRSTVAGRLA